LPRSRLLSPRGFFLARNQNDDRILSLWNAATACFDAAISGLDAPGQRTVIKADIPAVFYHASRESRPRPTTILVCNG
jgi:hypothetical protein